MHDNLNPEYGNSEHPQRMRPLQPSYNEKPLVKGMIFDMDGTVVDTIENDFKAWNKVFKEHDIDFSYEDFVMMSGVKGTELVKKYLNLPDEELVAFVKRKNDYFFSISEKNGLKLMPHVSRLLSYIKAASYKTALATGGNAEKVKFILNHVNLETYFDEIVTSDDLERGKPDPEIFLMAAKKLGIKPSEALVWEDAPLGVQAAKNGNFKCVAITASQKGGKKGLEIADKLIDSFEGIEIEELIEELFE